MRGSGAGALEMAARIVRIIAFILAGVIVLGILFVLLEGNPRNSIVSTVTDAARSLAGPFNELFTPKDPKGRVAVNWGIAAAVYVLAGALIAAALRHAGRLGTRSRGTAADEEADRPRPGSRRAKTD